MCLKMLYIPLDDRPVNTNFVKELSKFCEVELEMTPGEYLGRFMERGNRGKIANWLLDARGDVLIVSLDMLIYGGLIASRDIETSLDEAREFLKVLKEFKEKNRYTKIYGFSNIMRLSITIDGDQSYVWWRKISRYNELRYKIEVLGEKENETELQSLLEEVPGRIIEAYLKARERNHLINVEAIDLVEAGVLDFLILSQEDCSPYGLHVMEHRKIEKRIKELGLRESVWVYPGADEIGQMILARAVNDKLNFYPRVFIEYDDSSGASLIPKFEDRALEVTLREHIKSLGLSIIESPEGSDFIFAVSTPHVPYIDHMEEEKVEYVKKDITRGFIEKVKNYIKAGRLVVLGDLSCSNGGDPYLIEGLRKENLLLSLGGYSAWSTAGNALGTALVHGNLLSSLVKKDEITKENIKRSLKFLLERYVDDFVYQSIVRKDLAKFVQSMEISPFNMGKRYDEVEKVLKEKLEKIAKEYLEDISISYLGLKGVIKNIAIEANLPWNRVFEVECHIGFDMEEA